MSWSQSGELFAGLPMVNVLPPSPPAKAARATDARARGAGGPLPDAAAAAWRLSVPGWDAKETFAAHFARFRDLVDTTRVGALVIGGWDEPYSSSAAGPRDLLVEAAGDFPALRHLYLGDMSGEECEISWIQQCDITPLLRAFPALETLVVRGGSGLRLEPVRHEGLRRLEFESGGLPGSVVAAVGACELPSLTRLSVWLGVEQYGGDATDEDLAGVLGAAGMPALRALGLMNSDRQDEIAAALAGASVVARLDELDLSMGTLGDEGAEALLSGQPLTHLKVLEIRHHFMSDAMRERLTKTLRDAGVDVRIDHGETPERWDGQTWRYTEVSE